METPESLTPQQRFGRRLVARRRAAFLAQADLAFKVNVTQATVSRWESGVSVPRLAHRPLIAKAVYAHPDDLFADLVEYEGQVAA